MLRVGHYLNQFFAGIGAEEHANHAPERQEGSEGPGRALQALLKEDGRVVSTLVCGDNFFNERADAAHAAVREWLETVRPDAVVAGPAFAAGRYGSACAQVCRLAADAGIPAVTGCIPRIRLSSPEGLRGPDRQLRGRDGRASARCCRSCGNSAPGARAGPRRRRAICRAGCVGPGCERRRAPSGRCRCSWRSSRAGRSRPRSRSTPTMPCRPRRRSGTSGVRRSPW